jgi:hypothetical protein
MIRPTKTCRYCALPLDLSGRTNGKIPNYCRYKKCNQKIGFFEGKLAELGKLPDRKSKDFHTYLLVQMIKRKPVEVFWEQLKLYVKDHKKELRAIAKA